MCLILLAIQQHPEWPLILIANRDEFYARPSEQAMFWQENSDLLAGRDLQAGGTWLGIRKKHLRFAALTNYRNPLLNMKEGASTRGKIVRAYLENEKKTESFLEGLTNHLANYNAFNLICGHPDALFCFSSVKGTYEVIPPGIHGLSNHLLDTPWPKVRRGCFLLERVLQEKISEEKLLNILQDKQQPEDDNLPDTGIALEWERILAPIFIQSAGYGTRCSTLLQYHRKGEVFFTEVSWNEKGEKAGIRQFNW